MTDSSNVFNNFDNKPEFLTLIKSIIKKDDANRLLAVLNNLSQDTATLNTTDNNKCNEIENKLFDFEHTDLGYENLLHLAVLYHASACIQILINPPYMWSPYYVNKNGESAMQLAEQQGCFKLQYIMAANSPENFFVTPEFSLRSVSSLLIYPQAFITEPFSYSELFNWSNYDVMPGSAVEYLNNRIIGQYRSVHNLSLLFELIIATPEICPTILSDINEIRKILNDIKKYYENYNRTLDDKCRYAMELHFLTIFSEHMTVTHKWEEIWNRLFYTWLFYRTVIKNKKNIKWNDINTYMYIQQPFELQAICRISLRRYAVKQTGVNYAYFVKHLDLPIHLENYLLYSEYWYL
ncbi:unnamed protein product [Schistosoma haematobium]|nr:unnamed protein product [Schistosoma haematobium]CAH8446227.1 unnamed protein product [Schistosoma haematobium]